ncbi:MAG: hypothetical protein HKN22_05895, partial [Bacteroidia bacterium]|nr:hypothetical protein [Bacteroidia bacterium]
IVGFATLPILFGIFLDKSKEEVNDKVLPVLGMVFGGIWFCLIMPFQLAPIQMTMVSYKMDKINFDYFIERPFGMYCVNQLKEKDAFQTFYGKVDNNIITTLNRNDEAKILNVYTSLKYHISNNDIRVYEDNQLQKFNAVWNSTNGNKVQTVAKLKEIGIKYILISLATPNMDNTPERTLNKKFNILMKALINNPGCRLLYTNRVVERHDGDREVVFNGEKVKVKYELAGLRVVEVGTVALYEIL